MCHPSLENSQCFGQEGRKQFRPFLVLWLPRSEGASAQRGCGLYPLAVDAHNPGSGESAKRLRLLPIDPEPDVTPRNDRSVGIGLL